MLAGAGQPGNGAAAQVSGQVDLGGEPAAGAADPFPARFLVIRWSPLCGHQQPVHGKPGSVLMGPGDRRVGADRPVLALGLITPGPQPVQGLFPGSIQ